VVQVVVAQKEMRPKSTLTASMLAVREVPRAQANPDALHTVDEAVGRLVKENMLAGEQVLGSRLYARDEKPGLTFAIPPGKRAVSVAVNEVIGVAGFIKPGDHVDVLSTFDEEVVGKTVTVTVLQDVEVLAISQLMEDKDPNAQVATTATLSLSLDEAEKITLAEERGKLRLVLRPAGHSGQEYVGQATTKLMTQDRKGQGLDKLVPGARPVNRSATSTTASTSVRTPVPATPTPATTKVAEPAKQAPSWPVELYRGVNLEVVTVDEDGRDISNR
jgi:pilus assembly protein CpaB